MAMDGPDSGGTFLTDRQREVLELRHRGCTQPEIADRFGTSVPNVSAIESRASENIAKAGRTIDLAHEIRVEHWVELDRGTHLREIVETVYQAGDEAGVKVPYSDPELSTYLHVRLDDRLDGRRLTAPLAVGLGPDGDVVTRPGEWTEVVPD